MLNSSLLRVDTLFLTKSLCVAPYRSLDFSVNRKVEPGPAFCVAHNLPPCASMIDWQIDNPIPSPPGLVV